MSIVNVNSVGHFDCASLRAFRKILLGLIMKVITNFAPLKACEKLLLCLEWVCELSRAKLPSGK